MSHIGSSTSDPGLPSIDPIQKLRDLIENYRVENDTQINDLAKRLLAEITSKKDKSTDSLIARINLELVPKIAESIPKIQAILSTPLDADQRPKLESNIENLEDLRVVTEDLIKGRFSLNELEGQFLAGKFTNLDAIPLIKYLIVNSPNDSPIYADPESFFDKLPRGRWGEFVEILLSKNPNFIVNNLKLISAVVYEPELIQILSKANADTSFDIKLSHFDLSEKIRSYLNDKIEEGLSASKARELESKAFKKREHEENIDRFIRGELIPTRDGSLIKGLFKNCAKDSRLYSKFIPVYKDSAKAEKTLIIEYLLEENPAAFLHILDIIKTYAGDVGLIEILSKAQLDIRLSITRRDPELGGQIRLYLRHNKEEATRASRQAAFDLKAIEKREHEKNIDRFLRGELIPTKEGRLIKELFRSCAKDSRLYSNFISILSHLKTPENTLFVEYLLKENSAVFVDKLEEIQRCIGRDALITILKKVLNPTFNVSNPTLEAIEKKDRSLAFDVRVK